jgi:hypothetical protein
MWAMPHRVRGFVDLRRENVRVISENRGKLRARKPRKGAPSGREWF